MSKALNVGMVGYGFMAKAHSNAWRQVGSFFPELGHRPVLHAVAARNGAKVSAFADVWGYASVETDWRRVVERPDIELVDICVPNHLHAEIALAAAAAGKMILCEKPLAMDAVEGEAMVAAVERAATANLVCYNYRRVPAVTLARQLIDEGRIWRPFHYRAQFLQDWTIAPEVPQGGPALWRLDVKAAGSGVTGDLLAHCIDTALWLNGPITRVMAATETFVKERPHQETGKVEPVGIDDACMVMARFGNGSMGLFESTRYARGHKAEKTFELNGEAGSLFFDLHDPQWLSFFEYRNPTSGEKTESHTAGWRRIHVTNFEHPYMRHWWVPGLTIGYEHSFIHTLADFLHGLETGTPAEPTFRTALQTQHVCDAILRSAKNHIWVKPGSA
jgi:predicted dehydrogenase